MTFVALYSLVSARTLTSGELYQRCFSQLTGKSALTSPDLSRVLQEGADPITLCLSYFARVNLNHTSDPIGRQVLAQFHQLHRSWLKIEHMLEGEINRDFHWGTADIYDYNEPALHFTRAALGGFHIREAITRSRSLEAIREAPDTLSPQGRRASLIFNPNFDIPVHLFQITPTADLTRLTEISLPTLQIGTLVGLRDRPLGHRMPNLVLNAASSDSATASPPEPQAQFELHKNYGGGLIGSIPYLLLKFGHPDSVALNGVDKLPRKWAESIFRDLLCREVPALYDMDVLNDLALNSSADFRKSVSCLRCHSSLDQMAMVARNLRPVASTQRSIGPLSKGFATVAAFSVNQAVSSSWPTRPVPSFDRQTPHGLLKYRSYDGRLVEIPVTGLQQLGEQLAQTQDYYVCLAKRYFEYFTGISVSLDPEAAVSVPERGLSSLQEKDFPAEYRNYVIDLGLQLKSTGSVAELLKRILSSAYYKHTNFGITP